MRMRTVDQVYQHILESDPNTSLAKSGLYRLVKSGAIPSVSCGKKKLVAIEHVEAYLAGDPLPQPEPNGKPELRCVKGA